MRQAVSVLPSLFSPSVAFIQSKLPDFPSVYTQFLPSASLPPAYGGAEAAAFPCLAFPAALFASASNRSLAR